MKNALSSFFFLAGLLATGVLLASGAIAAPLDEGIARPWQLGFQEPATPVMEKLDHIHDFLLVIISLIVALVLIGFVYICIRFRRKANPVPSKTTHNTKVEIIWTVIPILILIVIAVPSLRIHYFMEQHIEPELTLKVTGYQWYWHYDYPDQGGFGFDSYMKKDEDLKPGDHRLLSVDNNVVVPVNTKVRVLLTGADVIHAWAIPAFGLKKDAVPGRLNETWFEATKVGRYYGQCSELCGVGHGFMPIVVDVVTRPEFDAWVKRQQQAAGIKPAVVKTEPEAPVAGDAVAADPAPVPAQPAAAPEAEDAPTPPSE